MADLLVETVLTKLQASFPEGKVGFVRDVLEHFSLEARMIGRDDRKQEKQLLRLQGSVEVFVRLLDQMRDYALGESVGRPDAVFVDMLLEYGRAYHLEEEIRGSLFFAARKLQRRGLVN